MAGDGGGDSAGFSASSFRVGGEDFVADLDLGDGFSGAVGHEDFGVAGEAVGPAGSIGGSGCCFGYLHTFDDLSEPAGAGDEPGENATDEPAAA